MPADQVTKISMPGFSQAAVPGRKLWQIDENSFEIGKKVEIVSTKNVPWQNVLMSCHTKGWLKDAPNTIFVCHRPMLSQDFIMAQVRFDDDKTDELLFTEHKIEPSCQHDCKMMHHAVERVLLKGATFLV